MNPAGEEPVSPGSTQPTPAPFWGYEDLALFVGMLLPALLVPVLLMLGGAAIWPAVFGRTIVKSLGGQLLTYVLLFAGLWQLFRLKYGQPLFKSLAWIVDFPKAIIAIFAGPVLAISIAALGSVFKAPIIRNPFAAMMEDRWELALVGVFAVILGPLAEELTFRGFLLPLLRRSLGAVIAVVLTALGFAALHGPQYEWSWQHILLVGAAGAIFGLVRLWSRSTAIAFLMHATYNLTFFAVYLLQNRNTFAEPI